MDFCDKNPALLAAITLKTTILEIWNHATGEIVNLIRLIPGASAKSVSWRPGSDTEVLVLYSDHVPQIVNLETEEEIDINYNNVTTACWHPRKPELLLVGFLNGTVMLYDVNRKKELVIFDKISNSAN